MSLVTKTVGIALLSAVAGCSHATSTTSVEAPQSDEDTAALKQAPDGSYVTLSGTVVSARDDAFTLDYGDGTILVEMDDWDWFPEGEQLLADDHVVVYGYIDDDFYEMRTIEASSVYVKDLGTQFYASGVDEENFPIVATYDPDPRVHITGTIKEVRTDEVVVSTSGGPVEVNVSHLGYDPLDDEGYQKLETGDRIYVTGKLGRELFEDLDLMADAIVVLQSA